MAKEAPLATSIRLSWTIGRPGFSSVGAQVSVDGILPTTTAEEMDEILEQQTIAYRKLKAQLRVLGQNLIDSKFEQAN